MRVPDVPSPTAVAVENAEPDIGDLPGGNFAVFELDKIESSFVPAVIII
jgi:hypothetical protein